MPQDTLDLEMISASMSVVERCLDVGPAEEVVVVTDSRKTGVARSIATASNAIGATTVIASMPLLGSHGNEPPAVIANAMVAADVCFTCTTQAITHTRARLAAAEAGTRFGILRGVTEDMMVEGAMTVDFEELRLVTGAVRDLLSEGKTVRVTSTNGTDISFSIDGCPAFSLDGYYHETEGFATLPPGESPTHPAEDTANGDIVFDVSMDNFGTLVDPISLEVDDGFVTDISGGSQADELRNLIDESDANAANLAEFAIGTNEKAKLIGNLAEDKKRRGTVHFAIGDNESLGGSRSSEIHLDGVIRAPTVLIDGDLYVDAGRLLIEKLPID